MSDEAHATIRPNLHLALSQGKKNKERAMRANEVKY